MEYSLTNKQQGEILEFWRSFPLTGTEGNSNNCSEIGVWYKDRFDKFWGSGERLDFQDLLFSFKRDRARRKFLVRKNSLNRRYYKDLSNSLQRMEYSKIYPVVGYTKNTIYEIPSLSYLSVNLRETDGIIYDTIFVNDEIPCLIK